MPLPFSFYTLLHKHIGLLAVFSSLSTTVIVFFSSSLSLSLSPCATVKGTFVMKEQV